MVGLAPNEKLSISRQVLREYLAVMTRPQTWGKPLGLAEAMADAIAFINRFAVLEDGPTVWNQLAELSRRYAFAGELRAGGDVLLDEIPLMLRCGFDSFEITHEPTLRALEGGRLPGLSLYYQPSLAPHEVPVGTRPWLRRREDA